MARQTKAQLKEERTRLLKEYSRRRKSIRAAELKELKQGGILTKSFVPTATAKQIENIGIKKLRSIVEELRPISARTVRKGFEYQTDTGAIISGTEQFHRQASERARRGAETRQGLPPELRRLRKAISQTEDTKIKGILTRRFEQERQEFLNEKKRQEKQKQFDEEQKLKMAQNYINAINDNDEQMKEYISNSYQRLYGENIEDNELVKDTLYPTIASDYSSSFPTLSDTVELPQEEPELEEEQEFEFEPDEEYDTDYEYTGDDYRIGEQYAGDDLSGYLSFLETVEELIKSGFYNTRGGLRRGKGRQGWSPYNFDEDKNTLLEMWRDTVDKYSNTPEDRRSLIDHIIANSGRLSELMTAIEYDSNQATYNVHYAEVYNILHFDAPTVEDLIDYGDIEEV